ncbi:DUF2520 domain-containing protein [Hymenobacter taeanensis]|uniref:DUF2520 domain-containing protein n=1 Tax=Hymenobacter taeanensis TaxID=2735321 RepID=A0A6M6BHI0_9BACT|nr:MULTISPECIES: Rossmann-like and DUF2520 domain-containing protein [Hymenobacter]QJX47244.1 DUF2520 domain-containing protein [Hymenobacter taeanensis]UOQ79420.1 F420-dependent NADP oxidoreductase [Hymenobacter sp. 5414T-23]
MVRGLRVVMLGAGRVAQHLGPALQQAGHVVLQVWSRTLESAEVLAAQIPGATATADATGLAVADIYIVAVPDAAVPAVLAAAQFPAGALVVHTAGALPLSVFEEWPTVRGGVLYPVQTFSPGRTIEWQKLPLCIEAADKAGEATLLDLASTLNADVRLVDTQQRLRLHMAAVFACNFTNHLLGISHALLTEDNLPMKLLAPLVRETIDKALAEPPFSVQTGPAARHDAPTLARHQVALAAYPGWQNLYKMLTESIQQQARGESQNNEGAF